MRSKNVTGIRMSLKGLLALVANNKSLTDLRKDDLLAGEGPCYTVIDCVAIRDHQYVMNHEELFGAETVYASVEANFNDGPFRVYRDDSFYRLAACKKMLEGAILQESSWIETSVAYTAAMGPDWPDLPFDGLF